ncbi:hypothetical protein [Geothrix oryzisoli]|uniref:hypothetical protein n=1 Tax=Geothrix oryzisoli TaxID=2922721 RepID=UPI001FAD1ACE|nr:hypothetical protein [Geothrix oryzisoli]
MRSLKPWQVCFTTAFLATGIPWWLAPYNGFSLSRPVAILGCLVFAGISAWAAGWTELGLGRGTLVAGAAVPCAVMVRVLVDGAKDPTSHNLWPIELIMMGVLGAGLAFAGALAGRLFRRMLGPG